MITNIKQSLHRSNEHLMSFVIEPFDHIIINLCQVLDVLSASLNEFLSLQIVGVPHDLVHHTFLHCGEFAKELMKSMSLDDSHIAISDGLDSVNRFRVEDELHVADNDPFLDGSKQDSLPIVKVLVGVNLTCSYQVDIMSVAIKLAHQLRFRFEKYNSDLPQDTLDFILLAFERKDLRNLLLKLQGYDLVHHTGLDTS